jgi:hypothetical protein
MYPAAGVTFTPSSMVSPLVYAVVSVIVVSAEITVGDVLLLLDDEPHAVTNDIIIATANMDAKDFINLFCMFFLHFKLLFYYYC